MSMLLQIAASKLKIGEIYAKHVSLTKVKLSGMRNFLHVGMGMLFSNDRLHLASSLPEEDGP